MINLCKLANEQNGVITLEQFQTALKELTDIVEADKPKWYGDGEYHSVSIYDGEKILLTMILRANEIQGE